MDKIQGQILSIDEFNFTNLSNLLTIIRVNDNTASIEIVFRKNIELKHYQQIELEKFHKSDKPYFSKK